MAETDSSITPIPKSEDAKTRVSAESRQTAEHAPTKVFTVPTLPIDELMKQQGIRGPQGLAVFADPEWEFARPSSNAASSGPKNVTPCRSTTSATFRKRRLPQGRAAWPSPPGHSISRP
jgi:hypothetical protein